MINPSFANPEAVIAGVAGSPLLHDLLAMEISPRYPSQLVEAALEGILLFTILWTLRTRVRLADGMLSGIFFVGYALLRIAGECFREPDAPDDGGPDARSVSLPLHDRDRDSFPDLSMEES